jgi:hypothetical protein
LGKDFWLAFVVTGQEEGETITAGKRPKQSTPTPKDKRCVSTTYPTTDDPNRRETAKSAKKNSKWKPADSPSQRENKCKEDGQALA